ncbi:exo-alpha-sialidase [Mariniphaga sediminis]|uniref:Exo-alpha-sialidase n=1 Tax=Mariniphaga sediminis TaxID=1628158 RepID=A0A399DAC0_9BACT|nr:sialidase family protein [Mariniphaga sediminis]RIH67132.1 exo-alpha-sialidase [Mariniphaga sediminis]
MTKLIIRFLGVVFICSTIISFSSGNNKKSFLDPPEIIKKEQIKKQHSPESRKFSGISSLAVSPGGRMWAVWYAGITPVEDLNNYVVVATSGDKGKTWEEVLVIDPDGPGPVRAYDPEVWINPEGKLWIFWAQAAPTSGTWSLVAEGTSAGVWALQINDPETNEPELNSPFRITDGVMMCKPIVLSTGEWVLPVSMWKMEKESARMVVSPDSGKSWKIRGGASVPENVRNFDEHMIVERKDGSLWMLVRTKYGIGESISNDRGYTWSPVIPSNIQHPAARFFIYRLNSGSLLLVKHGPIDMRTGRSHLMAFISKDDGHSWSNGLLLDERPGVSYPDGQQTNDGTIYITYDFNRTKDQNILITSFTEDDIKMGSDNKILEVFKQRQLISQGGTK